MSTDPHPASRPQLILIPGLLNDAGLWRDQLAGLAALADCRVADITRGESMQALADSVLADAAPTFALAGFSLGGYVAQEIARRAPQRIERLALLDTTIRPDTPARAALRRSHEQLVRLQGTFNAFGDRMLDTYLAPAHRHDEALIGRIRAMTSRLGSEVFLRQSGLVREDGAAVLQSLDCPLLIACGEQDLLTPLAAHREMAALNPRARLVVIPDSGHLAPMENPSAVTQALADWLHEPGEPCRPGVSHARQTPA